MGCMKEWKPVIAMLIVMTMFAIMNTLIKKVIDEGLNQLVLITARQLIATLSIAPVAYFKERKVRPKMTAEIFVYLFFSAILGASLTQYLFFVGLQYTSATFSCAFLNMVPIFTFLIAIPLRLERVNFRSKAGIAKILGATICLAGAMVLTFYKGISVINPSNHISGTEEQAAHILSKTKGKWMLGTMSLFGGAICWAAWFLLQSKVGKMYPALYSGTTVMFFLSCLQAAALTFATQRDVSFLILKKKLEIITVIFAGLVGSGFCFVVLSWCVAKRGPVFTSAFTPLTQIIVAGIDATILREQLHLGSILGSVLVIVGLYTLLWGKNKDVQNSTSSKASVGTNETNGPIQAV